MNKYFKFEPVVTFQALQVLAGAIVAALAFVFAWPAVTIGIVGGVVAAFFTFVSTFVRGAVTPNATLEQLKNLTPEQQAALKVLDR